MNYHNGNVVLIFEIFHFRVCHGWFKTITVYVTKDAYRRVVPFVPEHMFIT